MDEPIGGARSDAEAARQERELAEVTDRGHRLLRAAVERAQEQAIAARDRARAANPRFAPELWAAAEAKAAEGEAILAPGADLPFDAYSRAMQKLDEAVALYRRAEEQARDTVRPLHAEARQARQPTGDPLAHTVVPTPATPISPAATSPAPPVPPALDSPAAADIWSEEALAPIGQSAARRSYQREPRRAGRLAIGAAVFAAVAIASF